MNSILTTLAIGTTVKKPGDGKDTLWANIQTIINAVIGILGLICVIIMIIGGVQYMTSSGDPNKTKKARDTILYACIGLIICVLSFAIVNFVILNVLKAS